MELINVVCSVRYDLKIACVDFKCWIYIVEKYHGWEAKSSKVTNQQNYCEIIMSA